MSVSISGEGSIIGVDQGINVVGLTTLSGGLQIDDSIVHTGDDNTKIRFPTDDTVTVETAGSERLRITSTGSVGIGTDNPGNILHLQKNGGDAILELQNSGNGNHSGIFFVRESSGGVNKGAANIHVESNTSGSGTSLVFGTGSNISATGSERLRITSDGKIGIGTDGPGTNLDVFGGVRSNNDSENFQVYTSNGFIRGLLQVSPGGDGLDIKSTYNNNGYISASTISGGTLYERLRITSDGNVGIGLTNPTTS